jgi:ubiquinol-cytochrome c reductase cytochrome c1 subunit
MFGTFDQNQLQRGTQVYTEVCSACHGLKYVPFRSLTEPGGPGLTEEEVAPISSMNFIEVYDAVRSRIGARPRRTTISPRINLAENAPDLSLMAKARAGFHGPYGTRAQPALRGIGGPEYIASMLTGLHR